MAGRRVPQRRPSTVPLGAQMTVRQRLDDQLYELYGGSRFGAPEYGTYSGGLVLAPGTRVRTTWREESRLHEIDGPVRQNDVGNSPVSFFVIGGVGTGATGSMLNLKAVDADGAVSTGNNPPITAPQSTVKRVRFSPNGNFVAAVSSDELEIWAYTAGAIGAQIDTITLPAGTGSIRGALTWHPDSNFILVGFDDATTDSIAVYSWDGTTLAQVATGADVGGSSAATAADWHPDGDLIAVGYIGGKIHAWTWDGAALADVATATDVSSSANIQGVSWGRGANKNNLLMASNINSQAINVIPWNGSSWDARIPPAVQPTTAGFGEADWYPDGSKIVYTSTSNDVWGWTWDGSAFGTRVAAGAGNSNRRALRVDPTGTYVLVAKDGTTPVEENQGEIFTFDGVTLTEIGQFGSGATESFNVHDVDFPPQGLVLPAQQMDASDVTYTPADAADWFVEPDQVDEALDELAARLPVTRALGLSLGGFSITTGSPVLSTGAQWAFDAASDEAITGYAVIPQDYGADGLFRFHYLMASATSGTAEWEATSLPTIEGEDTSAAGASASVADTVQGTAADMGTVDVTPTQTYAAGDVVRVKLARLGTSDSATGDAHLIAVEFVYTPVGV